MKRSVTAALLGLGLISTASLLRAHERSGFSLSVLVDGHPRPEYANRGRVYVEALEGREFTIRLSNPTAGRVAVALSVDGRNVIDARRTSEIAATKWILNPGETLDVPGWQVSGETARRFFFTQTSRSYAEWLGDTGNVGTIEAVFFRERPRPISLAPKDERGAAGNAPPAAPSRQSAPEAKARDAGDYAATGIGDRTSFPVRRIEFGADPVPAARIALRYEFRPDLVRLGVLPRSEDDGLLARERARGFEHAYAPDPDAHR